MCAWERISCPMWRTLQIIFSDPFPVQAQLKNSTHKHPVLGLCGKKGSTCGFATWGPFPTTLHQMCKWSRRCSDWCNGRVTGQWVWLAAAVLMGAGWILVMPLRSCRAFVNFVGSGWSMWSYCHNYSKSHWSGIAVFLFFSCLPKQKVKLFHGFSFCNWLGTWRLSQGRGQCLSQAS